jgi:hypothetical protein
VGDGLGLEGVVDVLVQAEVVGELDQVVELDAVVAVVVVVEALELYHEDVGQLHDLEALARIDQCVALGASPARGAGQDLGSDKLVERFGEVADLMDVQRYVEELVRTR